MDKCALTIGGFIIGNHCGAIDDTNISPYEFSKALISTISISISILTVLSVVYDHRVMTPNEAMACIVVGFCSGHLLTTVCGYLSNIVHRYIDSNVRLSERINVRLDNIERNTRPPPYPINTTAYQYNSI